MQITANCKLHNSNCSLYGAPGKLQTTHQQVYTSSKSPGPQWPAKGKREYHPISRSLLLLLYSTLKNSAQLNHCTALYSTVQYSTVAYRGLIANEVFRRAHPRGLTMGQFLREEVATLLHRPANTRCAH